MPSSAVMLMLLLYGVAASMSLPVQTMETVTGRYGQTITVPCPYRIPPGYSLEMLTWYKKEGLNEITLLTKDPDRPEDIFQMPRINISSDSSLLISQGNLKDQGKYTCTLFLSSITNNTFQEYPSYVVVYKKPALPVIVNKAEFLQGGVLMRLGTCVARDAYPAADITWQKNGRPLVSDGMHIVVTSTVAKNSSTGLVTTSSILQYNATMQDVNARFNCLSSHELGTEESEPSSVAVYKMPALPVIINKAEFLEVSLLTQLGTCVARDGHPAANITWQKNGQPLVYDGMHVVVTSTVVEDSSTGLSTTSSILQYNSTKQDVNARFNCLSTHKLGTEESEPLTIPVHYPTERLSLTVLTPEGPITEGDDVTLKCRADGNPPPSSYNFHLKNQTVLVENCDSYTLTAITRDSAGEYKCSLVDDETIEASLSIAVSYLDLSLSPTGKVVKLVSEPLAVKMEVSASGNNAKVSWTKDGKKMEAAPEFGKLSYTDAGSYTCEVFSAGLTRRQSFDLVVEGSPVITNLTQDGAHPNSIQLACEAQGVPRPVFVWNVSTTEDESSYNERDGKATKKVTVVPNGQSMYVTCSVSNRLGKDARTIVVSSVGTSWPKLVITCVLMVLVLVALAGSMVYRRRRRGSWTPVQMDPKGKL